MTRTNLTALLMCVALMAVSGPRMAAAPEGPALAGTWTLNRALCKFPPEVGFGMDVVPPGAGDRADMGAGDPSGLTRGGISRPASEDEIRNRQQLVNEVKSPPVRLTMTTTATAVTMTDERGRSRALRPDGRDQYVALDAGSVAAVTKWEGASLFVRYKVEPGRELRYTYSRSANPPQLTVLVQFVERGGRDTVTLVYEPAKPGDEVAAPAAAAPSAAPQFPVSPLRRDAARAGTTAAAPDIPPGQMVPAVPALAGQDPLSAASQQPGAELKGLTALGVVVEELEPAATNCGLRQAAIETAVAKSFSDVGLRVVSNSDEDTYVYVHVMTTAMTTGFCFSRYDVTLYSYTTAKMSYGTAPVLAQVSLLHKGGQVGGGASDHTAVVNRSLKQYADEIAGQIRDANK